MSDEWDGSPSLFFAHDYHPGAPAAAALLRQGLARAAGLGVAVWHHCAGAAWPSVARNPHPIYTGAFTLEQAHILPTHTGQGLARNPANEEQLWSYLVQLTAGLRCLHQAGLAARPACLVPSKVRLGAAAWALLPTELGCACAMPCGGGSNVARPSHTPASCWQCRCC